MEPKLTIFRFSIIIKLNDYRDEEPKTDDLLHLLNRCTISRKSRNWEIFDAIFFVNPPDFLRRTKVIAAYSSRFGRPEFRKSVRPGKMRRIWLAESVAPVRRPGDDGSSVETEVCPGLWPWYHHSPTVPARRGHRVLQNLYSRLEFRMIVWIFTYTQLTSVQRNKKFCRKWNIWKGVRGLFLLDSEIVRSWRISHDWVLSKNL